MNNAEVAVSYFLFAFLFHPWEWLGPFDNPVSSNRHGSDRKVEMPPWLQTEFDPLKPHVLVALCSHERSRGRLIVTRRFGFVFEHRLWHAPKHTTEVSEMLVPVKPA